MPHFGSHLNDLDYKLREGLVAWWRLEENGLAQAKDQSLYAKHGTIFGATPAWGRIGRALSFDGLNDYVRVPYAPIHNPPYMTSTTWIKIRSSPPLGTYFETNSRGTYGTRIYPNGSYVFIALISGIWVYCWGNTILSLGVNYFITGTFDGQYMRVYLNGILDCAPILQVGTIDPVVFDFFIGVAEVPPFFDQAYDDAIISDVRIYNRALNASEMYHLYSLQRVKRK